MNRFQCCLKMSLLVVVSLACASVTQAKRATDESDDRPPNVVLIYADDLGYGDLGCYGATKIRTPNIDSLAKDGRRFTDAHSSSAVCTPSRYGLLTGQYPVRANGGKGVWGPAPVTSELIIPTETLTIGKVFQNKGYATACLGKWHLGFKEGKNDWQVPLRPGPQDLGFDHYFGLGVVNSAPPYVYIEDESFIGYDADDPLVYVGRKRGKQKDGPERKPVSPTPLFPKEASVKVPNQFSGALEAHKIYDDEKTGTLLTERAVKWIGEKKDKPFFLYFPTPNIHHPFTPNPRFKGTSDCGLYGDFVHELDWMVGEILKSLDENGLRENTLVIFTSDNGGMMNLAGRNAAKAGHKINGDLLGFKFGVWEGGHRIPFIARWPGKIPAGTTSDQLLGQVDMLATFSALTGQSELPNGTDSINMLPAMVGDPIAPIRSELLLAPHSQKHLAIRKGKWVYIAARGSGGFRGSKPHQHAWGGPPATALVGSINSDIENGKLKKNTPKGQLYDLKNDPLQTRNVFKEYPDVVKKMDGLLKTYSPPKQEQKSKPNSKPKAKTSTTSKRPPNFIVIFSDDQGYQDLGCYGSPDIKTPRIDQMASEGMRFTNFYAQTVCGPSRAALMTGCYPLRVARQDDPDSIHPELHLNELTIAELLKEKGYATAAVGKWDLAGHNPSKFKPQLLPIHQGFDEYFGTPGSNDVSVMLLRDQKKIEDKADMSTLTRRYTDEAIAFMQRQKEKPFFLYLAHTMPHTKLAASKQFKGKSAHGLYGDVIEELDYNVGRVLDSVKELEIDDNTYVVFTSDNGPWLIRGDNGGHAKPLRSGKTTCWEGGMRVPCIVRAPGKVLAGSVCSEVAATIDLLPTLCKLAGASVPSDRAIDGVDLSKIIHGEKAKLKRSYFYYQHNCLRAVRSGRWKLALAHTEPEKSSIRKKWKRHVAKADAIRIEKAELYDLESDVAETTDVAELNPNIVIELTKLADWARNDIGDHDRLGRNARTFGATTRTLSRPSQHASSVGEITKADVKRPNIVFILTDDLGYSDIGCYGSKKVKTPHIDRLAGEGIRFTNFHTAASICSPSRAAFLTGAYPQRCGLYMGINPVRTAHWFLGLHPDEITIAEQLKAKGYATHMVGKWHLGTEPEFQPRRQGFDSYYGLPNNYGRFNQFYDNDKILFEDTPLNRLTQLYTDRVTSIIRTAAKKDEPFFLYFAHNYPHTPFKAGKDFKGSSADGVRGDVIQELDWGVGEMMKALKESGIADNTIVVFTSDNGPTANRYAKPFRGRKYVTFEGGHRVPFIFHWPKKVESGSVSNADINAMDLFPTLCEATESTLPKDRVFDGVSLLPLIDGQALSRTSESPFYYYNCENLQALRVGNWKLHLPRSKEQTPFWEKNNAFFDTQRPVLYNLRDDVGEKTDVAADHPDVVKRLSALAKSTRGDLGEFMQRGEAQRPTGSLFLDVPVISHEKDWHTVETATANSIHQERLKRYPNFKPFPKKKRK